MNTLIDNKELFLSPDLLKKKIKIMPYQSIKIKEAMFVVPKKSEGIITQNNDYYLLIKNNLTLMEKYPIEYWKVPTLITLYD